MNIKNKNFYKNQRKLKTNIFGIRDKEKRVIIFKEPLNNNNNIKSPCFQKLYYLKLISKEIFSFFEELDTNNLKSDLCICLILNGFNSKRNRFVKSVINSSVKFKKTIISIIDITGLPHNGCRPKKIRRK